MARAKQTPIDDTLLKQFAEGRLSGELEVKLAVAIEQSPKLQARVAAISSDGFLQKVKQVAAGSRVSASESASDEHTKVPASSKRPDDIPAELVESTDYQVLKELGRGGMGVVYAAKYLPMDRMEVLKVLNPQMVQKESARQRFINEMKAIGKLNHPFIATAYQRVVLPTQLVFSMEYVPGHDLHKFIQKYRPIPVPVACTLASQIATALQHAHARKMVHRDIKPSNVMVYQEDGKRRIKILDFGLAKATSEQQSEGLTADGTMLGTPEYMAPEQALDAATADIRADIYGLGCTLYHLLSGKPPFTGTYQSVLMAHAQKDAPFINLQRPEIPLELAQVVAKMMAKQPTKRFQTPKEVATALKPFAGSANIAPSQRANEANIDTRQHLAAASRDTSVEGPASPPVSSLAISPAAEPDLKTSLASLKVEDRTKRKQKQGTRTKPVPSKRTARAGARTKRPNVAIIAGGLFAALILLGVVFSLRTKNGTLVIENLPADAQVMVDQETVALRWNEGKESATVRIKPGTRKVEVLSGGVKIAGETVSIDVGQEKQIDIGSRLTKSTNESADQELTQKEKTTSQSAGVRKQPDAGSATQDAGLSLFNGRDLDGWTGDAAYWRMEDDAIVGRLTPLNPIQKNIYLTSDASFTGDFELEFDCAIEGGNSGVVYRTSRPRSDPFHAFGLQIDIDAQNNQFGHAYEEKGLGAIAEVKESVLINPSGSIARSPLLSQSTDNAAATGSAWKHYRVVAIGDSIEHFVNGRLVSRISDPHRRLSQKGIVALQLHRGTPMKVRFRNISLFKGRRSLKNATNAGPLEITPNTNTAPNVLVFPAAERLTGKRIVLLAGDQEYRSEETMPMLGKILSQKHGFRCTVIFPLSVDGSYIDPTNKQGLAGLNALDDADLMIIGTRFLQPSEKEAKHITDFLDAGKPVIGIRTATHAFEGQEGFGGNLPYTEFGRRILGEEWAGHHGKYNQQGTRGIIETNKRNHPILNSVSNVFAKSNVYQVTHLTAEDEILMRGAVTENLELTSRNIRGLLNQPAQPLAWLHPYTSPNGTNGVSLCLTAGASVDFANEGLRRLIVNAAYFLTGGKVPSKADVGFIDPFNPTFYGHFKDKNHWKDADLQSDDYGLTKQANVNSSSLANLIQPGTTWRSSDSMQELLILDRIGKQFRGRLKAGRRIVREVRGVVIDDRISWLAKDVNVVGGEKPGGNNYGTIRKDSKGVVIDFQWQDYGKMGEFTLRPAEPANPPTGTFRVRDREFKLFEKRLTWSQARDECTLMGGTLAKIDSMEIHSRILAEAKKAGLDSVWFGASDANKEGSWKWIDETPVTFSKWGLNQPNNKQSSEHYALMIVEFNTPEHIGTWSDQPLTSSQHSPGFVCQWHTDKSPQNDISVSPSTSNTAMADGVHETQTTVAEKTPPTTQPTRFFNGRNLSGWQLLPQSGSMEIHAKDIEILGL